MTPDDLRAEQAKCLRLLRDVFLTPEYDKAMNAYTAIGTKEGLAFELNVMSDQAAIDKLCGTSTVEHPDAR